MIGKPNERLGSHCQNNMMMNQLKIVKNSMNNTHIHIQRSISLKAKENPTLFAQAHTHTHTNTAVHTVYADT